MRAEQVDDLPGACWNSAATSAARTVTNTMGSAPVEVASGPDTAARMTPTARRAAATVSVNGRTCRSKENSGNCASSAFPRVSAGDAGVVGDEEHLTVASDSHTPLSTLTVSVNI